MSDTFYTLMDRDPLDLTREDDAIITKFYRERRSQYLHGDLKAGNVRRVAKPAKPVDADVASLLDGDDFQVKI